MPSERIQRQIEGLLDEAEAAVRRFDWDLVRENAHAVLRLDPDNSDALTYLAAAERDLGTPRPARSAAGSPPQVATSTPDPTPSHPTSFVNGRYVVKRFLGEGGKKRVFLTQDTRLDRDAAFALIKLAGLDDTSRARIIREAQAMGKLGDHPHIVTVYEIGEEPSSTSGQEGQPYIISQFMPGGDVEALIEKAPEHKLTLERAIEIAIQVCRGLVHAHSHEIVHRDIKPGNVWLTTDGVAKIGDFGLAVALDRSRLTQIGMMVGTVSYMPPEQAMGGEPEKRSDLYSLGAMLYEMVTGRPPFVGDDSIGIISQHINTPPVSPSWHRPDLPQPLEGLILRLLEKDPNKRPASATDVLRALESINLTAHPEPVEGPDGSTSSPRAEVLTDNPIYRRTFVGREAELKGLHTAFDNAMSGNGSLAMVVGEPGIGKTAFCEQLATYVTLRGGKALVGHCYEEGSLSLPYLAFVEAMRTYVLARPPEALKEELGTGAGDVARIVSEIREKVNLSPTPAGTDPDEDRWRLLQSISTFLRNASNVQPLLIVLEDLHWADRGTLDLLAHIARNLTGVRLLIVGTYRDVEVDRAHPLSSTLAELRRSSSFGRVALRGLTVDEVHRMITIMSGQEAPWSLAEAIHRQTEGNPLFIQEVLRYIVEEGMVTRQDGRWQGTGNTPLEMSIPEGLRDVIGKRLSRLSPECNRLLTVAAVIGRDFALETLRAVSEIEEEPLIAAIEEAVRVGVLEEKSRAGSVQYRYAHAFFRQTLYEEMIAPRRIRLHQQVARALEQGYAARLEEHAVELAEHFSYSSDPADLSKAVEYGEMAARRAIAVYAYGEAVGHLERCLQVQEVLDPNDKAVRCDLLLALGEALMPSGEPMRAAEEVAEEAFGLAESLADNHRLSLACLMAIEGLSRYSTNMSVNPQYRDWVARADQYASSGTAARVQADLALYGVRRREGRIAEAWELQRKALETARQLNDKESLFRAYLPMLLNVSPQRQEERLRVARDLSEQSYDGVSARTLGVVLIRSGLAQLDGGDRERAEDIWRRGVEIAARIQDADPVIRSLRMEPALCTVDGRLEEALSAVQRNLARAEELGMPVLGRGFASEDSLRPLLLLGRALDAMSTLPQGAQLVGVDEPEHVVVTRVLCLAHLNQRAEAQAALHECLDQLVIHREEGETPAYILALMLEAAILVADHDSVSLLAKRLADAPQLAVCDWAMTCAARHLGAAALLLGEREKARAYYHQALEVCAKVRFRPEIALTRLQLAELLLQEAEDMRQSQGRGDLAPTGDMPDVGDGSPVPTASVQTAEDIHREAMEHLNFAIGEFQEMKMQPSLERALRHKGFLKA